MEELKYRVERKDDERELIICEGESAPAVGTIGIIGQGRKSITMKEVFEAITKDLFEKFLTACQTIEESDENDDIRIIMSDNTKERIIEYAEENEQDIEDYVSKILTINYIRDNEIMLGTIPSTDDIFNGDILSQIKIDDFKEPYYGEEAEFKTHHCGKYTKKRKYRNKKKKKRRK